MNTEETRPSSHSTPNSSEALEADAQGAAPNGSFALERFLTTGQSSELVDALQRLLTLVEASAAGGQQR